MRVLFEKVKEVFFAVAPITVIVLILHFTITPLPFDMLIRFLFGSFLVILGLSIFLFGIDIGITPLGRHIGSSLSHFNRVWIIVIAGLILGFFISIAEPDLQILALQVAAVTDNAITSAALLVIVSLGIAVMLVVGLLRIVYNFPLNRLLFLIYGIILLLAVFVPGEFLAISFDASGATTGALAVPFVLAIAAGVSVLKRDSRSSEEDSFGLVAITSTGAILSVILMSIISNLDGLTGELPVSTLNDSWILSPFVDTLPTMALESCIALLPVVIIYLIFQVFIFKLNKKPFKKILKGLSYTLIGLILFLTGVNAGFMRVGSHIGYELSALNNPYITIIVGFIIGLVTILAEPAVHVLTDQIETVTSGYLNRKVVLAALALGVGLAVALSILRIQMEQIQLWHYLLPGYLISIGLSFMVPKLFVGIAFDSGGVASGPMTATFILAFAQGIAEAIPGADVLRDAFGMIALVAMTPIITLQVLGLIVKIKTLKKKVKKNA